MKFLTRVIMSVVTIYSVTGCSTAYKTAKADLDKFNFTASYLELPHKSLDTSYHTYNVSVEPGLTTTLAIQKQEMLDRIEMEGWKKLNYGGHLLVQLKFEDLLIEGSEVKERQEIIKDKDGRETGKRSRYYVDITYSFASRATIKDYKGTHVESLILATRENKRSYTSESFSNATEARIYSRLGLVLLTAQLTRSAVLNVISDLNSSLTYNYGFSERTVTDQLMVLGSRAHPEYEANRKAFVAFKRAMSLMSFDQPLDEVKTAMQPAIDYYASVKKNYSSEDKNERKLLYASYFNLSKIYYYLDQPEAAMNEANELIMNGYSTRDGRNLEAMASQLQYSLRQSRYTSRHFQIRLEDYEGPGLANQ